MPDNVHRLPPRSRTTPMRPPRYLPDATSTRDHHPAPDLPSPVMGYLLGIALLLLGIGYLAGLYTFMKWMA